MTTLPTDPVALARIAYLGLDPERVPRSRAVQYPRIPGSCMWLSPRGGCEERATQVAVWRRTRLYPHLGGLSPELAPEDVQHDHWELCAKHAACVRSVTGGRESYWQEVGE